MNKIRLIRIFEIRGKIHPIESTVIKVLDGIKKYPKDGYINYMKDGKIYFTYYINSNSNFISIYSLFYDIFDDIDYYGCSYEETKEVIKYLLEKHLYLTIDRVY